MQAQQIIEQRVNGLGVSGAEVVLDGSNITITVPGDGGEQARPLGQTAQLRFREVIGGPVSARPDRPGSGHARPGRRPRRAEHAPGRAGTGPQPRRSRPAAVAGRRAAAVAPGVLTERRSTATPVASQDPVPPPTPTPAHAGAAGAGPGAGTSSPARPGAAARRSRHASARPARAPTRPSAAGRAGTLNCNAADPLRGYDDPAKPLVTCNQDGTQKYVLGPSFLEGTADRQRAGHRRTSRAPATS